MFILFHNSILNIIYSFGISKLYLRINLITRKIYFQDSKLKKISKDEDGLYVDIDSTYFVKKINEELRLNKPDFPLIKKLNDSTSFYKVSAEVVAYFNGEEN